MRLAAVASLAIAALMVYGRAVGFGAQLVDDQLNVFANPNLGGPALESLGAIWSRGYAELYIPVTYSVWLAIHQLTTALAPADPASLFHAANVGVHLLSSAFVFDILGRTVARERPWAAMAGALLFLLHPLQVEAVVWITGFKDTLSGALALAAVSAGLRALPALGARAAFGAGGFTLSAASRTIKFYALSLLLCALAILSKPTAVVVPALLLVSVNAGVDRGRWRSLLVLCVPYVALSGLGVLSAVLAQDSPYVWMGMTPPPLWLRPFGALVSIWFYFTKTVVPVGLSFDYGRRMVESAATHRFWWEALGGAAILVVPLALGRSAVWLGRGGLQALAGLAPVLGLIAFSNQQASDVADRYMYLPLLGVASIFAGGLARGGRRWAPAVGACVLAALTWQTCHRVSSWQPPAEAIFEDAVAKNERSAIAQEVLGARALEARRPAEAAARLGLAYAIRPHNDVAQELLSALAALGKLGDMLAVVKTVVAADPENAAARLDLGILLILGGEVDRGVSELDAALARPENAALPFPEAEALVQLHPDVVNAGAVRVALRRRPTVAVLARVGRMLASARR